MSKGARYERIAKQSYRFSYCDSVYFRRSVSVRNADVRTNRYSVQYSFQLENGIRHMGNSQKSALNKRKNQCPYRKIRAHDLSRLCRDISFRFAPLHISA